MTPLALWAAVAAVALVATSLWAILARETGVYVTAGLSFVAWGWLALTGGDVGMLAAGDVVWVRRTVASLQFVAVAMAVISVLVIAMRMLGAYPSPSENAAESAGTETTNS